MKFAGEMVESEDSNKEEYAREAPIKKIGTEEKLKEEDLVKTDFVELKVDYTVADGVGDKTILPSFKDRFLLKDATSE